jgi:micrococcal nuclease
MRNQPVFLLTILIPVFFLCGCGAVATPVFAPTRTMLNPSVVRSPGPSATPVEDCIPPQRRREYARVTDVTDGDSLVVEMNGAVFRVRLIGIDAPEMGQDPLAEESRAALLALVENRRVLLVRDLSEADQYGRLLRFAFADGVFVNRELARTGAARARPFPPDTLCAEEFLRDQTEAQQAGLGLWAQPPAETVQTSPSGDDSCRAGCANPVPGCLIKGNITLQGEKIYHVPSGDYYVQTVIEPEKGERWFCREADAQAEGWRRSKK